jgi:hypothetical protein
MERILCFSASDEFKNRINALESVELVFADVPADLAREAVEDPSLGFVVIHREKIDGFWGGLISSLSSVLPLLRVLVVLEKMDAPDMGAGVEIIRGRPSDPEVFKRIQAHINAAVPGEKRKSQRFDWPLRGTLRQEDRVEVYRVREISAGGAFLECGAGAPAPGTNATILIEFKDFSVLSGCLTLSLRPATERLPSGFGIQFTDLTEWSRKAIDRIVSDELVQRLLEPDRAPAAPTISALPLAAYERD